MAAFPSGMVYGSVGTDPRFISAHEQETDGKEQIDESDLSNVNIQPSDLEPVNDLPTFMDLDLGGELDLLVQTQGDGNDRAAAIAESFTFGQVPFDVERLGQFSVCHLGIPREWIGGEDQVSASQPTVDTVPVQETVSISESLEASEMDDVPELTGDEEDFEMESEDISMDEFTNCAVRQFHAAFSEPSGGDNDKEEPEQDLDSFLAFAGVDTAFFSSSMLSTLME